MTIKSLYDIVKSVALSKKGKAIIIRIILCALAALMTLPLVASAEVILQVSGQISGGTAEFTHQDLQSLPQTSLETSTVVTDGKLHFTGFLMRDLLEQVGATGTEVVATALNDYEVAIPLDDFYDFDVIVAITMQGQALERDDKGPLWIIYPRDGHARLQDIRYDYRWVWQLSGLHVQ